VVAFFKESSARRVASRRASGVLARLASEAARRESSADLRESSEALRAPSEAFSAPRLSFFALDSDLFEPWLRPLSFDDSVRMAELPSAMALAIARNDP
jgi:hypothetical protein